MPLLLLRPASSLQPIVANAVGEKSDNRSLRLLSVTAVGLFLLLFTDDSEHGKANEDSEEDATAEALGVSANMLYIC